MLFDVPLIYSTCIKLDWQVEFHTLSSSSPFSLFHFLSFHSFLLFSAYNFLQCPFCPSIILMNYFPLFLLLSLCPFICTSILLENTSLLFLLCPSLIHLIILFYFFVTIPHLQLYEHYTPTPPLHMKCSLHYLVLEMLHNDLISSSSIWRRLQAPLVSQEVEEVQALPAHLTRVDPCQPSTSMLWVQNQFDSEILYRYIYFNSIQFKSFITKFQHHLKQWL